MTPTPDLIARVARASRGALEPLLGADWSVPAHDMEWSCRETAVHLADAYFHHAARIAAQPQHAFVPAAITVDEPQDTEQLLEVIGACAELLRCAAAVADPSTRAWHPWGTSDPAGSIAMGAAEGLLHTWDICAGLGNDWLPPADLCRPVLERLFPDAPEGDPTDTLLWCTGREALPDRPRLTSWRWYGAVRD